MFNNLVRTDGPLLPAFPSISTDAQTPIQSVSHMKLIDGSSIRISLDGLIQLSSGNGPSL